MKICSIFFILSVITMLVSCRDFIEPSLENKKVFLLAPADSSESSSYTLTFWWEPVADALNYRLQLVNPGFVRPQILIADTLVRNNQFTITLEPGDYEWQVRAENGSSESLYSKAAFRILLSDISGQQVRLISPAPGLVTNQEEQLYIWEKLFGAGQYRLQIDTSDFSDESSLVFNGTSEDGQLTFTFNEEAQYQWRVRAEQDSIVSSWSDIRRITYDATPPGIVVLNSPASDQVIAGPAELKWNTLNGIAAYQLLVLKSDSTTAYSADFPLTLKTTSYLFEQGAPSEKIYWKVRAVDEAGNTGDYSELRNFTIE